MERDAMFSTQERATLDRLWRVVLGAVGIATALVLGARWTADVSALPGRVQAHEQQIADIRREQEKLQRTDSTQLRKLDEIDCIVKVLAKLPNYTITRCALR